MPAEEIPRDRAVVDRIVDGATAVLLVGPDETEGHVPAADLPDDAADGTWLVVDPDACPIAVLGIDRELTDRRTAGISDRMARLHEERRGGRFDR